MDHASLFTYDCAPMPQDLSAPATKEDVKLIMEMLSFHEERFSGIDRRFEEMEERIFRHFDLAVEQIRADLQGANKDEISVLDDRVTRLEKHCGVG